MNAIGWNPFNDNAQIAAISTKVSFYKGVPIIRTNDDSMSLGVIFLTKKSFTGKSGHYWTPKEILKHEYGHSVQMSTLGLLPYLVNIGIPSLLYNHDNAPWEITADILGGVNRNYNQTNVNDGFLYFFLSKIFIPFWWWNWRAE